MPKLTLATLATKTVFPTAFSSINASSLRWITRKDSKPADIKTTKLFFVFSPQFLLFFTPHLSYCRSIHSNFSPGRLQIFQKEVHFIDFEEQGNGKGCHTNGWINLMCKPLMYIV